MNSIEEKNFYEILGVDRSATSEQIREAYKEIAKTYHPDSNFFNEIVDARPSDFQMMMFKALTAAYSTLSNPEKRKSYDDTLAPDLPTWSEDDENVFNSPLREDPLTGPRLSNSYKTRSGAYGLFGVSPDTSPKSAIDNELLKEIDRRSGIFTRKIGFFEKIRMLLGISKYIPR